MRNFKSLISIPMKRDLLIAYIALAAVCIIWGTTYLALRIAVMHFPPFLFTALRQTTAGLLLLGFMFTLGKAAWPSKDHLIRQSIGGFFMLTLGNGLRSEERRVGKECRSRCETYH